MLKWITIIFLMLISSMSVRFLIIRPVLDYKLKEEAQKKIKEGQTFKEWFLYSRFRKYIPPFMIVWYFANFIVCMVTATISIFWVLIAGETKTLTLVITMFIVISVLPVSFVHSFVYTNSERGVADIVDRNKRYRKKKKKHPLQKKK